MSASNRKKTLAAVLAVIVVVAVASAVMIYQSSISPITPAVVTQTKPKPSLNHVTHVATSPLPASPQIWPAMLAAKVGFYDKYGLTVETVPTSGSLEALSAIASGKAEFGQMAVGVAVPARGNGTDLRYIFMTLERYPGVVLALEKSGIKTPKDLEGKTMGISFASSEYNIMPILGRTMGFDYKKVKYVNTSPTQYVTYLMSGQIDFTIYYFTSYYVYEAAATQARQKLVSIFCYDYFDMYGAGEVTTDSFIKQHPDVVKAFTEGYGYGLQYMIDNPKNASAILSSIMGGTTPDSVYLLMRTYIEFRSSLLPRQSGEPYGFMDDKSWNATISTSVQYLGAKPIAPRDMYTNEYIPTQYIPKAQLISPIISFYNNLYALPYEKPDTPTMSSTVT